MHGYLRSDRAERRAGNTVRVRASTRLPNRDRPIAITVTVMPVSCPSLRLQSLSESRRDWHGARCHRCRPGPAATYSDAAAGPGDCRLRFA